MRLVIVLSVAAAVTVMLGAIVMAAGVVMRFLTRHQPPHMTQLGLDMIGAGVAFGLVVLVVFTIARIGTAGRSRPRPGARGHRAGAGPRPAASHGRRPVLNPTNVYSPRGLLGVPRDGRSSGPPGGQPVPEILRTAGPPPGRNQDRPPPGWPGNQPRPGYQPGMNPGPPGRAPYVHGGQPVPPRDPGYPRGEASRSGHAMPPRDAAMHREGMPRRAAAPPRRPQAPREAQRPGMGPAGPQGPAGPAAYVPPGTHGRPGGAVPPHQPPPMGQRGGAPRHAGGSGYPAPGGPGYAAAGGRRSPAQGQPGFPGPEASGQFDGGYAPVIRASEYPARPAGPARPPGSGRPADPAGTAGQASRGTEAPADVYVYRDTGGQPGGPARTGPDERDAAYWYDLPGTGSGGEEPHVVEEVRGPFEPLVPSAGPPGATPRSAPGPAPGPSAAEPAVPGPGEAPAAGDQDKAQAQARKLEQIKDLYLTAEAIGEANVDKHFDQLLAQQRELISEYFKQSGASRPAAATAGQEAQPDGSGDRGPASGQAAAPESAGVAADQPRVW